MGRPDCARRESAPRILVEHDPAYTHLWAQLKSPAEIFGVHDVYFTVGGNVGTNRCRLPTHGIDWKPIWNPVVLDWWRTGQPITRDRFTTIADWWGQGYLEYEGTLRTFLVPVNPRWAMDAHRGRCGDPWSTLHTAGTPPPRSVLTRVQKCIPAPRLLMMEFAGWVSEP